MTDSKQDSLFRGAGVVGLISCAIFLVFGSDSIAFRLMVVAISLMIYILVKCVPHLVRRAGELLQKLAWSPTNIIPFAKYAGRSSGKPAPPQGSTAAVLDLAAIRQGRARKKA